MTRLIVLALLGVIAWAWWRGRGQRLGRMSVADACAILDLEPGADAEAVNTAYRRITARVHPDAGGSAELTLRVRTARDTLISDLNRRPPVRM